MSLLLYAVFVLAEADRLFILVQDIVFHIVWVLCWFIASVGWAVAFNKLKDDLNDYLDDVQRRDCAYLIEDIIETDRDSAIYVQAQIAVVRWRFLQKINPLHTLLQHLHTSILYKACVKCFYNYNDLVIFTRLVIIQMVVRTLHVSLILCRFLGF